MNHVHIQSIEGLWSIQDNNTKRLLLLKEHLQEAASKAGKEEVEEEEGTSKELTEAGGKQHCII